MAVEADGTPVIVYTSVRPDSIHLSRVALATGDAGVGAVDPGPRDSLLIIPVDPRRPPMKG